MENKNNHLQKNSSKELRTFVNNTVTLYNTTLKVRDFEPDNKIFWSKTRMTLAKCSLMLGSKVAPTDEEYFLLKETLIKSFKDFSPEEISDAFDKLVAGKLGLDVDKYGKVTVAYLGQILIAYRDYRNKELAQELKNKPKQVVIPTQEEREKIRAEFLENCLIKPYQEIDKIGFFKVDNKTASMLFGLFRRAGLVEVSNSDGEKYEKLAIQDLKNDAKNDFNSHKPMQKFFEGLQGVNTGNDVAMDKKITERCCGLYMIDQIEKLHKNKRDIKIIAKQL